MRNLAGYYHVNFIGLYLDFKPGFDFVDAIQNSNKLSKTLPPLSVTESMNILLNEFAPWDQKLSKKE